MAKCDLVNQVAMNNFVDSIDTAITDVGGDTSSATDACDYPGIIRDQLIAGKGSADMTLIEGAGVTITKEGTNYTFSSNADGTLTGPLAFGGTEISADKSIQEALEIILTNILPGIPSVVKGEIKIADKDGAIVFESLVDPDVMKRKRGFTPNMPVLLIYTVSQEAPVTVDLAEVVKSSQGLEDAPSDGNIYVRKNGKWASIHESGVTTSRLSPPWPKDLDIPTGSTIQHVFEELFDTILPAMPSVMDGKVVIADETGKVYYQHPAYPGQNTYVAGLVPNGKYLLIFVASQEQPICIDFAAMLSGLATKYVGDDGSTTGVKVSVDEKSNTISSEILYESPKFKQEINKEITNAIDGMTMSGADAKALFDSVFK